MATAQDLVPQKAHDSVDSMRSFALSGVASGSASMTELGFGCSALLGRASRRESLLALNTAFDGGITFFDTARSYGYGASEGLLGSFFQSGGSSRRDKVILATKFGILPVARNWKQLVKPVARAAVRLVPSLREAAHRHAANQFNTNQFSVAALQSSFETSLRQLRTDYVDMLFLHDPPAGVLEQDDLFEALGRLLDEGKVRKLGVAGSQEIATEVFARTPAHVTATEFALNLNNAGFGRQTVAQKDLLLIANHPFAGTSGIAATKERITQLAKDESLDGSLREKLVLDDPQLLPELALNLALRGTGVSAVVAAMMTPAHIHANIRAVEECRFTEEELSTLRQALA